MVKVCRLKGNVTRAKLWLKELPTVKLRRLIGSVKPAKLWLKRCPKVSVCKLLGSVTPAKLWLNERPKVKLCSLLGSVTRARLLLKSHPKINVCNVPGNVTPAKLWLNESPKVSVWRLLGNVTCLPNKSLANAHWPVKQLFFLRSNLLRWAWSSSRLLWFSGNSWQPHRNAFVGWRKWFPHSALVAVFWSPRVLKDIATWSQQQLPSWFQVDILWNVLKYTYSTVASSSICSWKVCPSNPLMLNEFTSTLASAGAHVSATRRLRSDLCHHPSIENSLRKHVWNCLAATPKR